ncbi:MAG: hypothetical protein M3433_01200 [Actinomycetota bacterium]|nr:hypothetical protein [Actinomycetota bacterium]
MPLPRLRFSRRAVQLDFGKGAATPDQARRALKRALNNITRHAARAGDKPTELCLIGQTRSGADYQKMRSHWMLKARGWSAKRWPARLPGDRYALFVAPVPPETAPRRRDHPRPGAEPVFVDFALDWPPESALAMGISVWLQQVAVHQLDAVALAPPILERYSGGRLLKREIHDYGLEWPLAAVELGG